MKKLILLFAITLMFSCSKEDEDCTDNIARIDALYKGMLENDGLSAEQRTEIGKEYRRALESPCDF